MDAQRPARSQEPNRYVSRLLEDAQYMLYRYRVRRPRRLEYATGAVRAITGRSRAELYADPELMRQAVHPEDRHLLVLTSTAGAGVWKAPATLRWVHRNGRIVWAELRRVPVRDAAGRLVAIEGIARDVTDRVEAQQQLRASQQQLRQLAAHLQTAREEERASLARELHDELGQTLTALKLELGRTTELLKAESLNPNVMNRLQSLVGLIEIGVSMVKRISSQLRPPELDHLGLAEAIRWEAATFRARSGLRCQLLAQSDGAALTSTQQIALFRIFQEALTNVVRHAHASAVRVRLSQSRSTFELQVSDNGRGITPSEASDHQSIGLLGMRERAAQVGATLCITGRRGRGTVVAVQLPLSRRAPDSKRVQRLPRAGQ